MKKIVYSLLIVFGIVLLTGCGKEVDFSKLNHVTCTKTETKANDTTTTVMTFSYDKEEKLSNFKVESDTTYNQAMSEKATRLTAKTMGLISKTLGVAFNSEVSENRFYFSFSGNIKALKLLMEKLDKNYKEELVTGDTKSEALNDLTKEGYTCQDYKK